MLTWTETLLNSMGWRSRTSSRRAEEERAAAPAWCGFCGAGDSLQRPLEGGNGQRASLGVPARTTMRLLSRWLGLWVALGLVALREARRRDKKKFVPLPYPKITNRTFINQCLDTHNKFRSEVDPPASNMLYMTWDLALARTARAWARRCTFLHNPFRKKKGGGHPDPRFNPSGENIWIGNAIRQPFDPIKAIRVWLSERIYYDYQKKLCTHICAHYTQIVWATTYKIGCAIVFCHKLGRHRNIEKFVCNYGPRRNRRLKPYRKGQPCSACSKEDTCQNKLCRNPERDHEHNEQDPQFIQDCVKRHNYFRSKVNPSASNMQRMTWDPALAKTAKAWAKRCHFDHNIYLKTPGKVHPKFTPVGENIWTGSFSLFSVEAALRNWYDESNDYNFESHSCTKVCGHYTQVVWATSYKVGCAVHFCQSVSNFVGLSNGAHFVCNYGPAGNFPVRPYERGRPCSRCNGEKCADNLCENPQRDQLISYSDWYPDWDVPEQDKKSPSKAPPLPPQPIPPHPTDLMPPRKPPHAAPSYPSAPVPSRSACDSYCIVVLILRPLFVLLTFGTVAMLTKRYPQLFMYENPFQPVKPILSFENVKTCM
ncbi:ancylostoma secreted protein-like isoform X1 [Hemicordylus capensis]|uniref:ancylostoma secreted protein-like isoform X1 n=1 Tax=Hemicordylus capensis TaxID=884348 RepID=UPI002303508B|nr:ancylostoma secreted protein-like isoform X1 [Hemicordylus capensis]